MMRLDFGKLIYQVFIHTFGHGAWPIPVQKRCHPTGACIMFAAFERSRKGRPVLYKRFTGYFISVFCVTHIKKQRTLKRK